MPARPPFARLVAAVALATVAVPACSPPVPDLAKAPGEVAPPTPAQARGPSSGIRFRAEPLPFRYERGESGSAWPVEPTGGGVGMLDFDGDGDLDLFFAQGVPLPVGKSDRPPSDVLLENQGGGRFVDISSRAGLASKGYGQGVTVADYDGDGDPDVYVTRYGPNTLWRNDGGTFVDATAEAGVACGLWSLGAAFADLDGDGDLDLFVATYFDFNPADAPFDRDPATGAANYGMPRGFQGQPDALYRNEGQGRFVDVTAQAQVAGKGRGMGVLAADGDGDGRVDLFVANDAEANAFWHNRGDGTFEDSAEAIGLAYNAEGEAEANMGIAHGDTDGDGLPDLLVTHFFNEHATLWRPRKAGDDRWFYRDETKAARLAADSRPLTGWGTTFADFDLDGHLDLVAANGHIRREPAQIHAYENPPILWRNDGRGRFLLANPGAGAYFASRRVGRGLAAGDLDGDGDLDLVIVHHHEPSVVLWNETPRLGRWLLVKLRGRGPNRDAIGARLTATVGPRRIVRTVDGGGGYLSSNDPRVHFGLGPGDRVDALEIRWPDGRTEVKRDIPADAAIEWAEGEPPAPR